MKFLLISPAAAQRRVAPGGRPPLATRIFRFSMLSSLYVAAAAPPGVETRILDEEVEPVDFDADADLVGLSFMTFNAPRAYEIADGFRLKGKPVVMGGYHPTFRPQEAIAHADAVCVGEAEPNLPRIIEDFRSGRLQSFYEGRLADLGSLPPVDRALVPGGLYLWADTAQATRGCPQRRVDALQATILTPFPGTPLFDTMEREGRIVDRDWSHYDFRHVVFEPREMSRAQLRAGHDWVLSRFYSVPAVLSRLASELTCLPFSTLLLGTLPLNYGYRHRLRTDGSWTATRI